MTDESRKILHNISAINHLKPGLPPLLIIHGDADKSVPHPGSLNFQTKLKEFGVPYDLITLSGAPHSITEWGKADASYPQKMVDWLARALGSDNAKQALPRQ